MRTPGFITAGPALSHKAAHINAFGAGEKIEIKIKTDEARVRVRPGAHARTDTHARTQELNK